ncbi:hypothetical protein KPY62_00755 [Psychrobacter sp. TAE2020]|uniref:hypothetical protein n=1 Tax=Psychrobacter sp. TAE2020 TaxID=2846762 RepID=UPI001C102C08|nr:hypothetical protein [Psychrobacter sp. TAE2020]MBU5615652.1 hypothetical protein [Psychrobacter sp. TAE2020]
MPNSKTYLLLWILAPISVYATFGPEDSGDYLSNTTVTPSQQQVMQDAIYIKQALAYKNYQAVAPLIHPTRGVRFSMYAYVDLKSDKVFSRAQFTQYLKASKIKFTWGQQDGTGDLYITPLPAYLTAWVDASKYQATAPTINQFQGFGNSLNNLTDIYKNHDFVEFYHPGSDKYSGMDWRAIRLVFADYKGKPYLVAIVSDQWTI